MFSWCTKKLKRVQKHLNPKRIENDWNKTNTTWGLLDFLMLGLELETFSMSK